MISKQAMIHPTAQIAADVEIGPWTIIGENVVIASGTRIGSHTIIEKNTKIGVNNRIYSHVVLGTDPQHTGYQDEPTWLEIGDHNSIREFVTINRGTKDRGLTKIGHHNYLMSYAHIAHDCEVGNHIIFANTASVAGHVTIGDHAILGAFSGVHQFVKIGAYSFLGRAAKVLQDILPYMLVVGNPGVPHGLNSVGLRRHGFTSEDMLLLKEAFAIIFRRGLKHAESIVQLEQLVGTNERVNFLLQAMKSSKRGIARGTAVEEAVVV